MRALAIGFVLASHCGVMFGRWTGATVWFPIVGGGFFGVDIFFVLSGYLVGAILIRHAAQPGFAAWRVFMTRRWLRTLPLYYVWLAVLTLFWAPAFFRPDHLAILAHLLPRYLVFLQNPVFAIPWPGWFGVSWSLAVEEWFYLLFATVLLGLSARFGRTRVLGTLLAAVLIVPPVARILLLDPLSLPGSVLTTLDQIGFGVALAWIAQARPTAFRRAAWALPLGLALCVLFYRQPVWLWHGSYALNRALQYDILALGIALCLPAAARWRAAHGPAAAAVRAVAKYSYGLYMIHLTVLETIHYYRPRIGLGAAPSIALACLLIVVLPVLSWRFLEQPMLRLRPAD
jgi:peptidoglycan/LPS O-acetylase OafA/YrhL